jgi:NAD(P)H-hydrate epimerase
MSFDIFSHKNIDGEFFDKSIYPNIVFYSIYPYEKNKLHKSFEINFNKHNHKKSFGKTLIIGGDDGYLGSIIIAGQSALKTGTRYIEIFTTEKHCSSLALHQSELITIEGPAVDIADYNNIIIGPGFSPSQEWSQALFSEFKNYLLSGNKEVNVVADAGFLSLLSNHPFQYDNWILTPHPGEAAKLLNTSIGNIQNNRIKACCEIQKKFGGVVVLKGNKTIIRSSNKTYVCLHGNHGMGTAGMGDCLNGVIASLTCLVNEKDYFNSILYAVGIHSYAADVIKENNGVIGILASDVISKMNKILNISITKDRDNE